MYIRHAILEDLPIIMNIYTRARFFMSAQGNPDQWGVRSWPPEELIRRDIQESNFYVCCESGDIQAVFYYVFGTDIEPTYAEIDHGSWVSDTPYGVIHRIASTGQRTGAGSFCILWAVRKCGHLRIDTHENNRPMRSLLLKLGFSERGIIYVYEEKDPRVAYEIIMPQDNRIHDDFEC